MNDETWVVPPPKVQVEYGSVGRIRFVDPSQVKMYDSSGNVMKCRCGKDAGAGAFGKECFIAWCQDCNPLAEPPKISPAKNSTND